MTTVKENTTKFTLSSTKGYLLSWDTIKLLYFDRFTKEVDAGHLLPEQEKVIRKDFYGEIAVMSIDGIVLSTLAEEVLFRVFTKHTKILIEEEKEPTLTERIRAKTRGANVEIPVQEKQIRLLTVPNVRSAELLSDALVDIKGFFGTYYVDSLPDADEDQRKWVITTRELGANLNTFNRFAAVSDIAVVILIDDGGGQSVSFRESLHTDMIFTYEDMGDNPTFRVRRHPGLASNSVVSFEGLINALSY